MTSTASEPGAVVVTGGMNGIGAAVSRALLLEGHYVTVVDIVEAGELQPHERLSIVRGDAANVDVLDRAFGGAAAAPGGLAGAVANAGFNRPGPTESLATDAWDDVVRIHLTGVFEAFRAAHRHRTGPLSLVAMSSLASLRGLPGRLAYSAAKSGINGLVRSLSVEWARQNVRVNAIAPGYIRTALVAKGLDEGSLSSDEIVARTPMGRFGETVEIASVVSFLLSDAASFVTGAVIPVDGGASVQGLPAS